MQLCSADDCDLLEAAARVRWIVGSYKFERVNDER